MAILKKDVFSFCFIDSVRWEIAVMVFPTIAVR